MLSFIGQLPKGIIAERVKNSPNYQDGNFQNLILTELNMDLGKLYDTIKRLISTPERRPATPLPSVKPDYKAFERMDQALIWYGHSSYLLRYASKTWLVDPVFSGSASPIPGTIQQFEGTDIVKVDELPNIDYLILTHDHYDHLDYSTIKHLIPKVGHIICPLGVDAHLVSWGATTRQLTVLDWYQQIDLQTVKLTATPARHFSGRTTKRNQSLWASYVLERKADNTRIFLGGDSGFGPHFEAIAQRFAPFNLAIMECGQYDANWIQIHAWPEDSAKAATILQTKVALPVHWGKFALGLHPWKEPITRFLDEAARLELTVATPLLGQAFDWEANALPNERWWRNH
jgi:L-ascorbate metabolism protein UlaG (beta-lactamase superfamily)